MALANVMRMNEGDIVAYISLHAYGQLWMYPWGYTLKPPNDLTDLVSGFFSINTSLPMTNLGIFSLLFLPRLSLSVYITKNLKDQSRLQTLIFLKVKILSDYLLTRTHT